MADKDWDRPSGEVPEAGSPTQELPTGLGGSAAWSSPSHPSAPGYPGAGFPGGYYPSQGFAGAAPPQTRPGEKPRRTVRLASAGVAGACLLVIGLGGGYLLGAAGADPAVVLPQSLAATTAGQAQASGPAPQAPAPQAPAPQASGSGGGGLASGGTGTGVASSSAVTAAVGTVSSISGASFVVQGLDGTRCNVTTTNSTRVATLRGSGGVRNLSVGDPVFVKGDSGADGVLTADLVIAGAFPDLGSGTR